VIFVEVRNKLLHLFDLNQKDLESYPSYPLRKLVIAAEHLSRRVNAAPLAALAPAYTWTTPERDPGRGTCSYLRPPSIGGIIFSKSATSPLEGSSDQLAADRTYSIHAVIRNFIH
jgi:hypothetical protein